MAPVDHDTAAEETKRLTDQLVKRYRTPDRPYFTRAEAEHLIGRRYRSTADYSGVPAGTTGKISGVYNVDNAGECWGVDVTWDGIRGGSPADLERGGLTDGFSRSDLFLVFTGGPDIGRRAMVPLDGPDGGPDPDADRAPSDARSGS